jgi:transposase-like protein
MVRKRRPNHKPDEKVAILREVLLDHQPVSDVCERHRIQPRQFYTWQKQLFENGGAAFSRDADRERRSLEKAVEKLTARLAEKDEVIAAITEEHVALKKDIGEL